MAGRSIDELLRMTDYDDLDDLEVRKLVTEAYTRGRVAGQAEGQSEIRRQTMDKLVELTTASAERAHAAFTQACAASPTFRTVSNG